MALLNSSLIANSGDNFGSNMNFSVSLNYSDYLIPEDHFMMMHNCVRHNPPPGNTTDFVTFPSEPDFSRCPYFGTVKNVLLFEMGIKIAFYVLIILLALVGNTLVVYIVWRNKRMRTTTNFYIVNLAISDLMVTSSCTWVHLVENLTEGWVLGAFFCKFNSFAQVLSLVSSILTLTLISCDRFFGIVFAMKAHMTERRSNIFILMIWICAIGISSPLLLYREQSSRQWLDHKEIWCDDSWPAVRVNGNATVPPSVTYPSRTFYYTFVSVVLYFCPILIMTLAYSMIIWRLWSSRIPGEHIETEVKAKDKVKKKVVIMLVIILSVFAICWLPFQIAILYSEHRSNKREKLPQWFHKFHFFANFIAFANSAFNPIIYTGFNENFKRGFKAIFTCNRNRRTSSSTYKSIGPGLGRTSSICSSTMVSKNTIVTVI